METYDVKSLVSGHHIFNCIQLEPQIGEQLVCKREVSNARDGPYAVDVEHEALSLLRKVSCAFLAKKGQPLGSASVEVCASLLSKVRRYCVSFCTACI